MRPIFRVSAALALSLWLFFPAAGPSAAGQSDQKVSWIIDGDTVVLTDRTRLRLAGLDAPEIGRRGEPNQPFAREARNFLVNLVKDRPVRVEPAEERYDQHGRLLGYLFVGDRLVNVELVQAGLARVFLVGPNLRYADEFIKAETDARSRKIGLWRQWRGRWGR